MRLLEPLVSSVQPRTGNDAMRRTRRARLTRRRPAFRIMTSARAAIPCRPRRGLPSRRCRRRTTSPARLHRRGSRRRRAEPRVVHQRSDRRVRRRRGPTAATRAPLAGLSVSIGGPRTRSVANESDATSSASRTSPGLVVGCSTRAAYSRPTQLNESPHPYGLPSRPRIRLTRPSQRSNVPGGRRNDPKPSISIEALREALLSLRGCRECGRLPPNAVAAERGVLNDWPRNSVFVAYTPTMGSLCSASSASASRSCLRPRRSRTRSPGAPSEKVTNALATTGGRGQDHRDGGRDLILGGYRERGH